MADDGELLASCEVWDGITSHLMKGVVTGVVERAEHRKGKVIAYLKGVLGQRHGECAHAGCGGDEHEGGLALIGDDVAEVLILECCKVEVAYL